MKKQYSVGVQCKYQQEDGTYLNLARLMRTGYKSYYDDLESAVADLKTYIEERNKGARTEKTVVGGIGIETVIDAETADSLTVVDWYIKVREVTPWETVARMDK